VDGGIEAMEGGVRERVSGGNYFSSSLVTCKELLVYLVG
jgi:hypothetical protein